MKKIYTLGLAALMSLGLNAQQDVTPEPNRMVISTTSGEMKGYKIDNVAEVGFINVNGEVACEFSVDSIKMYEVYVTAKRTEQCVKFKLHVAPAAEVDPMGGDMAKIADFIDANTSSFYTEDFVPGQIGVGELAEEVKYYAMTLGFDEWGAACEVRVDTFTTMPRELYGDPKVETKILEANLYDFTAMFKPSYYTSEYYCLAGEKETIMLQYEQMGPWFGFKSFSDMVRGWGAPQSGNSWFQWTEMEPSTEYCIFVLPIDAYGKYADVDTVEVSTTMLGGPGKAGVTITPGDFKMVEYGEEGMKSAQFVTFTPNDQTGRYRVWMAADTTFTKLGEEAVLNKLQQDPMMPTIGWWCYEEEVFYGLYDPNTDIVAVATGKNANGEWDEGNVLKFTTPAEAAPADEAKPAQKPARKFKSVAKYFDYNSPEQAAAPAKKFEPVKANVAKAKTQGLKLTKAS